MKTAILATSLLIGFAVSAASLPAKATTIDAIDVTELSFATPDQAQSAPLLHTVKGGKARGGKGGRDRDNLASDGNIGNGTLRARIQNEKGYGSKGFTSSRNGHGSSGPFTFFQQLFGN